VSERSVVSGGRNIAMKVPSHQFQSTVDAYRALGLPVLFEDDSMVTFEYGPIKLHVDRSDSFSQAELWLEFLSDDLGNAEIALQKAGFDRRDEIENLAGHRGFWVSSPASIIHLVSRAEWE
jgi:hypothetical protein